MLVLEKKFKRLAQKSGKTIYQQQLLQPNDKILVGLSGGKDSYLLLEILADRKRHLPFLIDLFAVHVKILEVDYLVPINEMKKICDNLNIPFLYKEISIKNNQSNKLPCFICSWNRRKILFSTARELGCNKVALAHHFDDAIQTFMMNLIYHSSISSLPYELSMFNGQIVLIRPLLDISEKEIINYTKLANYPNELKKCTHSNQSKRAQINDLINTIKKIHPVADKNIFHAGRKIFTEYLPTDKKNIK